MKILNRLTSFTALFIATVAMLAPAQTQAQQRPQQGGVSYPGFSVGGGVRPINGDYSQWQPGVNTGEYRRTFPSLTGSNTRPQGQQGYPQGYPQNRQQGSSGKGYFPQQPQYQSRQQMPTLAGRSSGYGGYGGSGKQVVSPRCEQYRPADCLTTPPRPVVIRREVVEVPKIVYRDRVRVIEKSTKSSTASVKRSMPSGCGDNCHHNACGCGHTAGITSACSCGGSQTVTTGVLAPSQYTVVSGVSTSVACVQSQSQVLTVAPTQAVQMVQGGIQPPNTIWVNGQGWVALSDLSAQGFVQVQ